MRLSPVLVLFTLFMSGCFPGKVAHLVEGDGLQKLQTEVHDQQGESLTVFPHRTKVFTSDGTIVLFPGGFTLFGDSIAGRGERYALGDERYMIDAAGTPRSDAEQRATSQLLTLSRADIAAMTYYEEHHNFGEVSGSVLLGAYGGAVTFLSGYCLACPKCCFGSCPTVYLASDTSRTIQAECFSYCVSPFVQRPDLDLLQRDTDTRRPFSIRITNEALESHLLNSLELLAVSHPAGSTVFPTDDGRVLAVSGLRAVRNALTEDGASVSEALRAVDGRTYRSGLQRFDRLTARYRRDALTFDVPAETGSDSLTIVLRARNTLLTTALFYEVVLGSRGVNAMKWTARMAEDEQYARLFYALYDDYAGVRIEVERNGAFEDVGRIGDIGPIAWKDLAIRVPSTGDVTTVRMSFFPDNIDIDYLACAGHTLGRGEFTVSGVRPRTVADFTGAARPGLLDDVRAQDDRYLHSTPGDSYTFTYDLPRTKGQHTSVLLRSQGYYYEWLRGNWVRNASPQPPLDIFDVAGILQALRGYWMEEYRTIEEEFFRNRIPLKEGRS